MPADNPNAFKHQVNLAMARRLAESLRRVHPRFDQAAFLREVRRGLEPLELKPRIAWFSDCLAKFLPRDYLEALNVVVAALGSEQTSKAEGGEGVFFYWVHARFVETRGLGHVDESLRALREITKRGTSEFAVRPFLAAHPKRVLAFLKRCARDRNPHVRRWVSEGTRPRLPWGARLPAFVAEPSETLALLELLKNDGSLYVRTSVANHLGDVAKDHPDRVIELLERWKRQDVAEVNWIAERALRHLVKQGHPGAFRLLGFAHGTRASLSKIKVSPKRVRVGERLTFEFELTSRNRELVMIDYAIYYQLAPRARRLGRKVYKLKRCELPAGKRLWNEKQHVFRPITTRTYYKGLHRLEILGNGMPLGRAEFTLDVP